MGRACGILNVWEERKRKHGFVVKPAGKRPFGRPKCRLEKLLQWT